MATNRTRSKAVPPTVDQVKNFTFDLARISLDELLDVLELADMDLNKGTPKEAVQLLRSMRKCLVKGSDPLTGADLQPVLQGFMQMALGGGPQAKN